MPILWRVLKTKGKNHLLLAENAITGPAFHEKRTNISWSDSTLRKWLNHDFINQAFSPAERMSIVFTNTPKLLEYLPNQSDRALGEWW